ncbi:MAG: SDR family oxidoreductase [Myxococcales bacterium]|nr:SDR family oxidoreductase [Myxococcales bacterium]
MRTVLVTGANRGIGYELCRQYAARGDRVVACCRGADPELTSLGVRVEEGVDVTRMETLDDLAHRLGGTTLDIVVNNAGVLERDSLPELDIEAVRRQFDVNALGPLRVTKALMSRLARGAKIAIITSQMGSIADNRSGAMYGYRMSKAAVNAAGVSLARDLAECEVAVALLHPGYVKTRMTNGHGNIGADQSASWLIERIDELSVANSGRFLHANGSELPW